MNESNDDIPADEMLLAEAIAAAKRKHLGWCKETPFADENGESTDSAGAVKVCALGALHFARRVSMRDRIYLDDNHPLGGVVGGNDIDDLWTSDDGDLGESLGWAFRCAMEEP